MDLSDELSNCHFSECPKEHESFVRCNKCSTSKRRRKEEEKEEGGESRGG